MVGYKHSISTVRGESVMKKIHKGDLVRFNLHRDSTRYCVGLIVEIEEFEGVPWYKILVGNVFEHVPVGYGGPPFEIKVLQ